MTVNNPFWEAVKDCVEADSFRGNLVVGEFRLDLSVEANMARSPNRQRLVRKYCWTIPDSDTVAFVAKHTQGGLVDPIAGTGYWAYLPCAGGSRCRLLRPEPGYGAAHQWLARRRPLCRDLREGLRRSGRTAP